ncbi:MAG TPA: hypothetical protein VFU02_22240 [Polyangiaceae bacterium]|nr:hypothetical protein [Polyangiaceae bacterium]
MPDKNEQNTRDEPEGGRAERLIPELIKRLIEGIDRFAEGKDMRQRVSDLKLPKEALALLLSQLEESKNGLYRALAKELRDFLEQTNFTDELVAALTKLTFEIRTEIRFVPSQSGSSEGIAPEVRAKVNLKRDRKTERASAPAPSSEPSAPPSSPPMSTSQED